MSRTYTFFFALLFLVTACGKGGSGGDSSSASNESVAQEITSSDVSPETPAPPAAQGFLVNARFTSFTSTRKAKVKKAIAAIKAVIGTDEFKERVLNFRYNGSKKFNNNNGLTNAQIYKKILQGSEKLTPGIDGEMDLFLETYYTSANVIGYTKPSIKTIFMNTRYLDQFATNKIAMNLTHEWLHKLGFGHASEATSSRPYSVPYGVGYIMRDLVAKYY